jgi:hypothetical protein
MQNFATITLDVSLIFYEMFFLHMSSFQFIKVLNYHRLHYWTFIYCQTVLQKWGAIY